MKLFVILFALMATCNCDSSPLISKNSVVEHKIAEQIENVRKVRQISAGFFPGQQYNPYEQQSYNPYQQQSYQQYPQQNYQQYPQQNYQQYPQQNYQQYPQQYQQQYPQQFPQQNHGSEHGGNHHHHHHHD